MSFRDLRSARVSRQSNKSFVVRACSTTVQTPSGSAISQPNIYDDQLVWTVKDAIADERSNEDKQMEQDLIQRLVEKDKEREKATEATPVIDSETTRTTGKETSTACEPDSRSSPVSTKHTDSDTTGSTGKHDAESSNNKTTDTADEVTMPLYSEMPDYLVIKRSKKRGRGLWTEAFIKAGTTIFTVRPHSHALSRLQLNSFCSACSGSGPTSGLKKCGKCKAVYYCGPMCQNTDWLIHKQECEALKRWATIASSRQSSSVAGPSSRMQDESDDEDTGKDGVENAEKECPAVPSEAIRCLARIMWKRRKVGSDSMWWRKIDKMQSHHKNLAHPMIDAHIHLGHGIVRFMGLENPHDLAKYDVRGVGELVELISKFTSNSFTLTTPSLSPIGVVVSPLPALINHSCIPNVAVVFPRSTGKDEPLVHVVAIQDIQPGTELFTSYIDVTLPRSQRQKELKETYNFACECDACVATSSTASPDSLDWREQIWCPNACGGTCPLPLTDDETPKCVRCGERLKEVAKIVDILRVGQDALKKSTSLQFSDPEQASKLTRNVIPLLERAGLPPSSHPLLGLYRLHQSLCISFLPSAPESTGEVFLYEALRAGAKSAAGLESILRSGHPVRALAFAELGKLLCVDEPSQGSAEESSFPLSGPARLSYAVQALRQAYSELQIAFGSDANGGAVGREVREMLVNLEKELTVWNSRVGLTLKDTLAEQRGKGVKQLN